MYRREGDACVACLSPAEMDAYQQGGNDGRVVWSEEGCSWGCKPAFFKPPFNSSDAIPECHNCSYFKFLAGIAAPDNTRWIDGESNCTWAPDLGFRCEQQVRVPPSPRPPTTRCLPSCCWLVAPLRLPWVVATPDTWPPSECLVRTVPYAAPAFALGRRPAPGIPLPVPLRVRSRLLRPPSRPQRREAPCCSSPSTLSCPFFPRLPPPFSAPLHPLREWLLSTLRDFERREWLLSTLVFQS